jgi:hypothetical protein
MNMAKAVARKTVPKKPVSKAAQAAAHQGRAEPRQQAGAVTGRTTHSTPNVEERQRVATRPDAPTPASIRSLPKFMQSDANLGKENIGRDDIEIPRLKLMQGLSPELQEFDGLKAGHFFHPIAEHIFDEPFRAVPVFMDKRYILWRPRDAGGGILARADDGVNWSPSQGEFTVQLDKRDGGDTVKWRLAPTVRESGLAVWGTFNPNDPNSPPAATEMFNFLLAFPDEPELMPAVLSFQRSSIKKGRRFNAKLKTVSAPIFGTIWEFRAVEDSNNRGQSFFNIDVRGAGLITDEQQYLQYRQMYETFSERGLAIKDIEGLQSEDDNTGGDDDDKGEPELTDAPRF